MATVTYEIAGDPGRRIVAVHSRGQLRRLIPVNGVDDAALAERLERTDPGSLEFGLIAA